MSILCAKTERRVTYTAIYIEYFQRLHRCQLMMIGPNQDSSGRQQIPSFADIRSRTLEKFGVKPCLWQLKVAQALLKGDWDVICTAGTGMGKTLGFWLPLLFRDGGIQIIVTPLNMLGKQNAASLAKAGIRGIFIDGETVTHANFLVSAVLYCKYQHHLTYQSHRPSR